MEEMNKAYFQKLARQLMFDVSDEEAEDQITQTISREDALKNAKAVMAGHVHVPKVVK